MPNPEVLQSGRLISAIPDFGQLDALAIKSFDEAPERECESSSSNHITNMLLARTAEENTAEGDALRPSAAG
jgi:hypothetical protein